jgi:Tfp pilus assembly protein PilO
MENMKLAVSINHVVQVLCYQLRQLLRQKLGWQGSIGLLLMISSLCYLIIIAVPKVHEVNELQIKLTNLNSNTNQNMSNRNSDEKADVTKIFYDALPLQVEANSKINTILRVATDNGLVVNKVEYEQPLSVSTLIQYQIKLPLTGNYLQIRQFINQVLNTLPSIALSHVSLKREGLATDLVDAQIQFSLYLQKERQ